MEETKRNKEELKIEPLDTKKQENQDEAQEEIETRRKQIVVKTRKKAIIALVLILVVLALIVLVLFCLFNKINTKVYHNVYLGNKNISSMDEEELKVLLQEKNTFIKNTEVTIMQENEIIIDINAEDIDLKIDIQQTIENVMGFGRGQDIVANNVLILKTIFKKHYEEIIYNYSEQKLDEITQKIRGNIKDRVIDDAYVVNEKEYTLTITKGISGKGIDTDTFKKEIVDSIINGDISYNLVLEQQVPEPLDVDIVYSKIVQEAKDAYIDESQTPIKFITHIVGLTFDKDELRRVLQKEENQKEGVAIKFKLKTIQPKIKITDLKWNLYEDKLSSTTTYFTTSTANRASNLKLGLSILEGTVIMPGETFSFNNTMGDCGLSSRGFKPAATFKAGKVVNEIGGGICQVSSTLYNSALKANLEIVKRSNHALPVGYVKPSLDATVYYPYVDFKFKNTRNYPIKITTSYNSSGRMSVTLMGTFEDVEYDVILTSKIIKTILPKIQYENDNMLEEGATKVIVKGSNGYVSCAYKTVKLNGKVIKTTLLSEDTYKSTTTTIATGTKISIEETPQPVISPVETPEKIIEEIEDGDEAVVSIP